VNQLSNFIRYIFGKIICAMKTKFSLTIEKDIIEKAKSYAKQTGRSLSDLIESYLESLTRESKTDKYLSPKLRKIIGAVKLPKALDKKKELGAYFEKKYL
jgi:hypothetical protein